MKSLDRLLLIIYLLALTCVAGIFLAFPFGFVSFETAKYILHGAFADDKWYYFIGTILLIIFNIKLIFGLIYGDSTRKAGVVRYTSEGEVNISFDTIKSLVVKAAGQSRGIKDINVMIKPGKDNINILIKVMVFPDINIPQTVREVQENVKNYVQGITEVPVGEVKVMVMDIASSTRLRIE
jgi:uncharacterized alkaline shock family protein YloU